MLIISGLVVQGWWCRYGYDISMFHESYMRYEPRLTGVDHPTDHIITCRYTPYMISFYTGCWIQKHEPCTSSIAVVVQWLWYRYGYAISLIYECNTRYGPLLTGVDNPIDHCMTSIYTQDMLNCAPGFRTMTLNHVPRQCCSGPRMMIDV